VEQGDNGMWRVEEALEAATILKGAAAAMVAHNQALAPPRQSHLAVFLLPNLLLFFSSQKLGNHQVALLPKRLGFGVSGGQV